jgi:hypothetical protein
MDSAATVLTIEQGVRSEQGLGRLCWPGWWLCSACDWSASFVGSPPLLKPDLVFSLMCCWCRCGGGADGRRARDVDRAGSA